MKNQNQAKRPSKAKIVCASPSSFFLPFDASRNPNFKVMHRDLISGRAIVDTNATLQGVEVRITNWKLQGFDTYYKVDHPYLAGWLHENQLTFDFNA